MSSDLVAAVIAVCLTGAPSQCERHEIRVEPRACHIAPLRAEVPIAGTWQPATARVICGGR